MKKIFNLATLSFMWLVSLTLSLILLGCGPGEDETYTGVVSTFIGAAAGLNSPSGITTDGANLYVANTGDNTILKIVLATREVTTLVDTSVVGISGPVGITIDGTDLYVVDKGNHKIHKIDISGVPATSAVVTTSFGTGAAGFADTGTTPAQFNAPSGIVTMGSDLYVVDTGNHAIRKISAGVVSTIAGESGVSGFSDKAASGTAATITPAYFKSPAGIATDGTSLYVADTGNHAIRKIDFISASDIPVTTIAGAPPPTPASGVADGPSASARFKSPVGLVKSGAYLYVADRDNHTIRKINILTYEVTTLAGAAGSFGSGDGTGVSARFNSPQGITTGGASLYVTDTGNNAIRKIE